MLEHSYLSVAELAARRAGEVLHKYFRKENRVDFKSSYNLVSQADLAAQRAIVDTIRDSFPNHSVLGEETIAPGLPESFGKSAMDEFDDRPLWIVDPLDGTNNFCHGLDHFAVSIACYCQGAPELGVVYRPRSEDWFVAARGQGAFHNGERCQVADHSSLGESLIGTGFYYDRGEQMRSTLRAIEELFDQNIHGIRRMGTASMDLCQVGRGSFGGYFEFELAPWDYAAGKLFVHEAGGMVTDCLGRSFSNGNSSIIAACPGLHESMLSLVRPWFQKANAE